MTEKLKSVLQLVDEQGEIMAWIVLIIACIAFFAFDVDDFVFGGLVLASCALMGLVEKVKAGPVEFQRSEDK